MTTMQEWLDNFFEDGTDSYVVYTEETYAFCGARARDDLKDYRSTGGTGCAVIDGLGDKNVELDSSFYPIAGRFSRIRRRPQVCTRKRRRYAYCR